MERAADRSPADLDHSAFSLTAGPLRANVPAAVLQAEADRIAVMAKAKDTVLAIFSAAGSGGGSGVVIIADGYALTNFHVAQPCGTAMKCGMADGKLYDAVIVGIDPTGDVALIKLFGRSDFPARRAGRQRPAPRSATPCFAMGNPFLLATDFQPDRHLRHHLRHPPLPVPRGHAAGIHRLPPDRRLDQPGQLRRAAVRRRRAG